MFSRSGLLSLVFASQAALFAYAAGAPDDRWDAIHPNRDVSKCLDVRGDVLADGTPVQLYDCNGSQAQKWRIHEGNTTLHLYGTTFCLDAGATPANGVGLKIWTCYDDLTAQKWFYTADNRIALQDQGFCLDVPNGVHVNSNQIQTWKCSDNNLNQVWTLDVPL